MPNIQDNPVQELVKNQIYDAVGTSAVYSFLATGTGTAKVLGSNDGVNWVQIIELIPAAGGAFTFNGTSLTAIAGDSTVLEMSWGRFLCVGDSTCKVTVKRG